MQTLQKVFMKVTLCQYFPKVHLSSKKLFCENPCKEFLKFVKKSIDSKSTFLNCITSHAKCLMMINIGRTFYIFLKRERVK
ncbi:MAG: hypothetical protein BGO67_05545 [Alphaproteobacteria bacterium 41-28]|nr:MAG: hypothetical protein BGO67_05545 [Alphaproteobacteria bacterium 41-28]